MVRPDDSRFVSMYVYMHLAFKEFYLVTEEVYILVRNPSFICTPVLYSEQLQLTITIAFATMQATDVCGWTRSR